MDSFLNYFNGIWITVFVWFLYRNNAVYKFRKSIMEKVYDHDRKYVKEITNKEKPFLSLTLYDDLPAYNKMLFSNKSLKLENWIPPEYLKELES